MKKEENDQFLEELEKRLEENRQLAEKTILPRQLYGLASYLGFHSLRVLVISSLLVTVGLFWLYYPDLIRISKKLFFYE